MKTARFALATLALLGSVGAHAASSGLLQDFDSLGGNDTLMTRAKTLSPDTKVEVVQDRIVDRRLRVELAPEYSNVLGGDAYNKTQFVGMNLHFHITPRWSLGARYNHAFNKLTAEGEFLLKDVDVTGQGMVPDIDFPKSQTIATLNWYPIYGKMNLYDLGVFHFDAYALLGGGTVSLRSGSSTVYLGGGGIGLWVSQHLSARFEMTYQTYNATRISTPVKMETTVATVQIGYLL